VGGGGAAPAGTEGADFLGGAMVVPEVELAISLLGHRASSRFLSWLTAVCPGVGPGVGAGEDFLPIFSSGAVIDLVLLAAMARAGTDFRGGRQMGLILGFSLSLISALI